MPANLARIGIRGFRPTLAHAEECLEKPRTPEGSAVPPNTLAELQRDMVHLRIMKQQMKEIETTRAKRLNRAPREGRNPLVRLLVLVAVE